MQLSGSLTTSNNQRNKKIQDMKRILIALMVATLFASISFAQKQKTVYKDSTGQVTITVSKTDDDSVYTPKYKDTAEDGVTVESESTDSYDSTYTHTGFSDEDFSLFKDLGGMATKGIALAFFVLILVFGFPIFVIFIAFYFRYKNRRERYKLVEKAIAAGQPIPEGILKESLNTDTRSKGIKNMCLGAGLFIFLWAIADSFALGCIGLLIMFTGLGQWLVARNQHPTDEQK